MTAWHWQTASEVGRAIASGELSSVSVPEHMLERIGRYDSKYHCYQTVLAEDARATALRCDNERQAGQPRGPLHGVPIALKDLFAVAGAPRGAGGRVQKMLGSQVEDAEVVRRLRDAGVVILGTLSMTEGALSSYHPDITPPVNPWQANRWSGVSSSGSGVAVAAGLCFAALGTDTGGSIRFPAAVNGVVGMKPSYGRVPDQGCFPLAPSMDHIGPLTRSVEDAAHLLQILIGDEALVDMEENTPTTETLKVGIDRRFICDGCDANIVNPILQQLEVFTAEGAELVEIDMPPWETLEQYWMPMCAAEALEVHRPWFPEQREEYGSEFSEVLDRAATVPAELLSQAKAARAPFRAALERVFQKVDVVVCPSLGIAVPASQGKAEDAFPGMMRFTAPFNASGHPTLSLPCGFSDDGMPLSLQLLGALNQDSVLLWVGQVFQSRSQWHCVHPNLDS